MTKSKLIRSFQRNPKTVISAERRAGIQHHELSWIRFRGMTQYPDFAQGVIRIEDGFFDAIVFSRSPRSAVKIC
jgi:hypothetical protein